MLILLQTGLDDHSGERGVSIRHVVAVSEETSAENPSAMTDTWSPSNS